MRQSEVISSKIEKMEQALKDVSPESRRYKALCGLIESLRDSLPEEGNDLDLTQAGKLQKAVSPLEKPMKT